MGLELGDSRLIKPERLAAFRVISTHALPLRIFCEYLAKTAEAKIALLLIEPKKADFGGGLTPVVKDSVQEVVDVPLRVLR